MEYRRVGALAGVVSVLGLLAQYVPAVLLERWIDAGFEGALPTVGTTGQTVTLYSLLGDSVGPVVTLGLAVGLGYYAGRGRDVSGEYRRFGRVVAAGSALGVAVIWAIQLFAGPSGPVTATSALLSLATLASLFARISLVVAVGAFAGAAISQFRTSDSTPRGPVGDEPPASSSSRSPSRNRNGATGERDVDSSTP